MNVVTAKGWAILSIVSISLLVTCFSTPASGQISISATGASYSENFDGMGAAGTTYLTGWTGYRYAGTSAAGTLPLVVDDGTSTSGAVYNDGASGGADRAFGMLASGSTIPRIGAHFVNNTGVTITTINFAGLMKQWRSGSTSTGFEVDAFAYSMDATDLAGSGTWTNFSAMDLVEKLTTTTTAAKVDGNSSANQTSIAGTVSGLSWANGASMWIRWSDANDAGSDCELSIDNLTMSFNIALPPPGKGTASITPTLAQGAVNDTFTVTVHGQSPYTLTNANVVVPGIFTWSHSASDVSLTGGGSPSTSVSGDTVKISGMTVSATDSIRIILNNITPPDSTDTFVFHTQTATQPDSILDLPAQPSVLIYGTPHSIGDLKANDVNGVPVFSGKYVTILGVVTVGGEFGSPSYIQDATGGIAVFGVITSGQIAIGDEVEIVGFISPFNGLTEVNNPIIIKKVSSGNTVNPVVVTCHQANFDGAGGVEQYEGRLVRINAVIVTTLAGGALTNWTVSGSGTNYRLQDTDTLEVRVDNNVNFANTPAPQGSFDVIGVLSQFKSASPFIGGYQLMPRSLADIISSGPIFASAPVESNLQPTSLRISWTTINNGTTRVRYGLTTAYELGLVSPDNTLGLSHAVDLTGLTPSTIYHVQAFSDGGSNDTSFAGDLVVSSASPPASTGQINVYFNKSVNTSVSLGENALGNQDFISLVVNRIDQTQRSIDLALYSLSATNQGDVIASHLIAAHNRGVSIRVICEADNQNAGGGSIPSLSSAGIPVINDKFDAVWFGAGLMHNKFWVFDGRGGAPESVWVWGGSWNPTSSGTLSDRQNVVEIQDQALAGAYTAEFNQMWGSSTETPNASTTRFGARKLDITPHNFLINGIKVSSYFSPSDHTTTHITDMIAKAQHSVSTCILTYTRKEIADAMISRLNAGSKVRVIVDNNTDQGNQFSYLQTNLVDIHLKGGSGLLHHKYTTIDADQPDGPSYLETGSHNYSSSAENSNDENSLIFENKRLANLYLQEFTARYYEAGGTDSIHLSFAPAFSVSPSNIQFGTVVIGNSRQDSFTVSNTGNLPLILSSVTSGSARFTVSPSADTIAPAASHKFTVTFSPLTSDTTNSSIMIVHNAQGSPDSVTVHGAGDTGVHPVFSVSPASINFDTVFVGITKDDSFSVSNTGSGTLVISNAASTNPDFSVLPVNDSVQGAGSKSFTVRFSPGAEGPDSGAIILTHNAPGSPDTVLVRGVGTPAAVSSQFGVSAGWNMVSLPVRVTNGARSTVFPAATSRSFAYAGGYVVNDTLAGGRGYWLKFPDSSGQKILGFPVALESLKVAAGWNMIGSISAGVPVGSIGQNPPNNVISNYFMYETSYTAKDTVVPGRAYWVKVKQSGSLILSNGLAVAKAGIRQVPEGLNHLVFTDAAGHSQTLYFGSGSGAGVEADQFVLPPVPPEGAFDTRFASGTSVEICANPLSKTMQVPIAIQAARFPMKISWMVDGHDAQWYTLTTAGTGGSASHRLVGDGSMTISDPRAQFGLTVSPVKPLPREFTLYPNYPNPFNPTTRIPFALPYSASVTLTVFNALGEAVWTGFQDAAFDAGYYEVPFDASSLASGVYYYRMSGTETGGNQTRFQHVGKLLLMK